MKNTILTLLLSSVLFLANAQQTSFELMADISPDDEITDVVETPSGDFVAVSTTNDSSNYDITLMKFSADGTILNSVTIGTSKSEFARSICNTADGGYFITGAAFTTASDYDAIAIKVDSAFNIQFFKRYGITNGNDYANEGFEITPGNYTFTGTIAISGSAKPAIINLDSNGDVVSQHYLNTNQFASPDYHGTYLGNGIIGFAHLSNMMALLDTAGNIIRNFNFSAGGFSTRIGLSNDNMPVALGLSGIGGPSGESITICKGDTTTGTFGMTKMYSLSGYNVEPAGFYQDANGNYFIAGNLVNFSNGYSSPIVIKTDSTGTVIWANKYKPSASTSCMASCIIPTSDGGCLIAGNSFAVGNTDYFIAKIDSAGSSSCNTSSFTISSTVFSVSSSTLHSLAGGTIDSIIPGAVVVSAPVITPDLLCLTNGIKNTDNSIAENINVYPTLFDKYITIEMTDATSKRNAIITDLQGRIVFKGFVENNEKLNLEKLQAGQYILKIVSGDENKNFVTKIVKANSGRE